MLNLLLFLLSATTIGITQCSSMKQNSNYFPVRALSIYFDGAYLKQNLKEHRQTIKRNLEMRAQQLSGCQVVGSISQIRLTDSSQLQFYFTYKLDASKSQLIVNIFARNSNNKQISDSFVVVLDFLIARFPVDYSIRSFNMTSYQEHITYQTNKSYELIFFLNGFNNFKLSGNVTHSYQEGADVYTVHYMSCAGESNYMGWNESEDYLIFTLMIVPITNLVQKFKVANTTFNQEYPANYRYFYGIKGSTQSQFIGSFQQRNGGVNFDVRHLGQNKTYGIVLLPYPQYQFIDERAHRSSSTAKLIVIFFVGLSLLVIVGYHILKRLLRADKMQLIQETSMNSSQIEDPNDKKKDPAKLKMNTVEEVDEKYEASLRGSYAPKEDVQPNFIVEG